ncbi:hypothetical protein [Carboxylicivirga marina]|uniref:Uncharacterized protein n=1 Tax=Carboxylicivirga marina TaxID=2800988 RepID=A0ABS1HFB7_9BACT|nr:hypothetical protein [Carboxylicivirga marina]MBK3516366.1 hypothetical protein [Carboxylicivirga marina]
MKSGTFASKLILSGILMTSIGFGITAQTKKKNQVKIKVISSEGEKVVEMDTTFNHDVFVFQSGDETKIVNIDSIMEAHHHGMDKQMRVMAYKMDSLNDFHFEFDGDMEKMHIEMEKILKEKGIELKELEELHKAHKNRIVIMQGEDGEVDIEEFINEDGDHVKIIKKEIHDMEDHEPGVKTFIIASDSHDIPVHWKEKHEHRTTVQVESIPMEDIAFLKEIGVSAKKLTASPLELQDLKVKIEKIMEDEKLQTLMHIECELPEGSYQLEMFNQAGSKVKEKKALKAGPLKEEFDLKEEEAPYYFILSKNNQLFGRKIIL